MFSDKSELKAEVRSFTGYTSTKVLSDDGLDTAYRNAKRHIRIKKSLDPEYTWFGTDNVGAQDALYWWTCLFSKTQTGELDSQDLQAGAVDQSALLAKSDDEVTTWYRQAVGALESVKATSIIQSSSPSRTGREYEPGTYEDQSGGSSTNVTSTDI